MRKTRRFALGAVLAVSMLQISGAALASGLDPALEAALSNAAPGAEFRVIVELKGRADTASFARLGKAERRRRLILALRQKAAETQGPVLSALKAAGARGISGLWISNRVVATVRADSVRALAALGAVESVALDQAVSPPQPAAGSASAPEWNIRAVKAPELWALGSDGSGVVVASMDTGVDPNHQDLRDRWRGGANGWFDPNNEHSSPFDSSGHGTQTMGLVLGGSGIGVAPGARWIAVKIFNDAGTGYLSTIHLGFQWLLDPDNDPATDDAPDIVNGSWGLDAAVGACAGYFEADIDALHASGIVTVFSAGNAGPGPSTSLSPANYTTTISAGAIDEAGIVAPFSSRGPSACDNTVYPEAAAPGVNLKTADLTYGGVFPASYAYVNGTSYASAHVSGVTALLLGAFPSAVEGEISSAIRLSSLRPGAPDNATGYGAIDALAAYNALSTLGHLDRDGDGFVAAAECDDSDAAVYPGARELMLDYIDQDCNGFDMTLGGLKAFYNPLRRTLYVEAASALGSRAGLTIGGLGQMYWSGQRSIWVYYKAAQAYPGPLTVSGREGSAVVWPLLVGY